MRTISRTSRFKKDYKREARGRHKDTLDRELLIAIDFLVRDEPLPVRLQDYALTGEWRDHRDCHLKPDLVLIYSLSDPESLNLVRLGSHSELGL